MRAAIGRLVKGEDGQVMVFVAILMTGLVSVVGLVTDGGIVFSQRRDLQNVADAAALAGAMQIDERAYRASGQVVLDEARARDAAEQYLQDEEDVDYSVQVSPAGVEVSVSRRASTSFLRLVGIDGVDISAVSSAAPRHGVVEAQR
jgi:Flp pilus assembly protein TadG